MSYVITGGTGFIGSHIARHLVREGEKPVLYDLYPDVNMIHDIRKKVTLIHGDVTNIADLIRTLRGEGAKCVIHMAYFFTRPAQKNPLKATEVNCVGTVNVFEAARLLDVEKVVWASSVAVYGSREKYNRFPLTEEDPVYPTTLYGACKVYNEFTSELYRRQYGLHCIGIRVSGAYGWGMWNRNDSLSNFLFDLFLKGAKGKACVVKNGDIVFDWHYVKDIAKAFVLGCRKTTQHGIFNATGFRHKVVEAVEIFRKLVPNPMIKVLPHDSTDDYIEDYPACDSSLIKMELGYSPEHGLEEGIQDYLSDIRRLG